MEISLQTDSIVKKKDLEQTLYIYSNICKETIVNGSEHSLLRRIEQNNERSWNYVFDTPFYFPLNRSEFQEIEFDIKTSNGDFATFISSPVHITLHFKRYPFYSNYESL
jgi:hypothetical protein